MAPRIRLGYNAKPWHDFRDIAVYNKEFFGPEAQKRHPEGHFGLCTWTPDGQWIYRDCMSDDPWVIYAAATPPYNAVMCKELAASDEEEVHGLVRDTAYFEADHHFEAVKNAQEIRDSLLPDATLQDAMQALFRTCKGCAQYVKK